MKIKRFEELSTKELYHVLKLRNDVFVVEQNCVYPDCDGKDLKSWHLIVADENDPEKVIGYLRILPKGLSYPEVSIGRVVVDLESRGKGIGKQMLSAAIDFTIHELHENKIRISAQSHLSNFYESLGFKTASEEFVEDGIPHLEMVLERQNIGLMIVDVQKAMFECDGGVYKGEMVLANIKTLLEVSRSKGVPVVYIQHTELSGEYGKGTDTWEISPDIQPLREESVVEKNYWDAFQKTELEATLKRLGLRKLMVVGMQTEFCMDTTIRNAYSKGYQMVGVKGCHTTFDSPVLKAVDVVHHHESIWDGRFLTMLTMEEAIEFLQRQS